MVNPLPPPGYGGRSAGKDYRLFQRLPIVASLFGWLVVWAFWLSLTHRYHPTIALALIVTTSLIVAFAAASYCNHLVLAPRFLALNNHWQYIGWLVATMSIFTAGALAVIRVSYFRMLGPDADPFGVYKHFAIDFFGMVVHVAIAALIVRSTRPFERMKNRTIMKAEQSDPPRSPVGHEFES